MAIAKPSSGIMVKASRKPMSFLLLPDSNPLDILPQAQARRSCAKEAIASPPLMSGVMIISSAVTAGSST